MVWIYCRCFWYSDSSEFLNKLKLWTSKLCCHWVSEHFLKTHITGNHSYLFHTIFFFFSNWEAYDSWQNWRGQLHKQSVLADNGWRKLLNNPLILFNKSRWMLEWGGWKTEIWFWETGICPQVKRHVIINASQHHCVDNESPQSVSQTATVPRELRALSLSILYCVGGLIIKYGLSLFTSGCWGRCL